MAARFFKTRAAATEAVLGGRVRLNGGRVKAAKDVRAADPRRDPTRRTVVVRAVGAKRCSARIAATLYEETAQSIAERERAADKRLLSRPQGFDAGGPRPSPARWKILG